MFVYCDRDGHVLPGNKHGGDRLLNDLSAVSSPSTIRDQGQWFVQRLDTFVEHHVNNGLC